MKIKIWIDISPEGYCLYQKFESDIMLSKIVLQAPYNRDKRYLIEADIPDPYEIIKLKGETKEINDYIKTEPTDSPSNTTPEIHKSQHHN